MGATTYWGPVAAPLLRPSFTWTSEPNGAGIRTAKMTGYLNGVAGRQLSELVGNPDAQVTIAGVAGVLAPVFTDHEFLRDFTGWYLLISADYGGGTFEGHARIAQVTVTAAYLGQSPQVVIARSSVPRGNDFSVTAKSMVASAFRPESDSGDRFVTEPGGIYATRNYDPTYPYDPAVPTPSSTAKIGLYTGTVTATTDDIDTVCLPRLAWSSTAPNWLTQQGGNVRAFDRRAQREVYGPHPFVETTDLGVDNGLIRFWVGNRGLAPSLNVQAFDGTSWREEGTVQLGSSLILRAARLQRITSDDAVVVLTIDSVGDTLVILKRGEPFIRILATASNAQPTWSGMPPGQATVATNGTGTFGKGLDGTAPNARLLWPPLQAQDEWAVGFWLHTASSVASDGDSGYFTIYDDSGAEAGKVYLDADDAKIKFDLGTTVISSAAQTYSSGQDLFVMARFSTTEGMALTVRNQSGSVAHVTNASTDRGTTGLYTALAFSALQHIGSDLYPADDTYPADDLYPGDLGWSGTGPGTTQYPGGVIDNLMLFDGWVTDAEAEALAAADTPLDGLPEPWGRLVLYAPFDVAPIVNLGAVSGGRRADPVTDEWGFTKGVAFLDTDHLESAALLARVTTPNTAVEIQQQLAAENTQHVRVR